MALPGVFGVFFYRSANPRTLEALKGFLPVPAEGLTREFASGDDGRGYLRANDSNAARRRRAPLLHQQPPDRPRAGCPAILDKAGVNPELRNLGTQELQDLSPEFLSS